MFLFARADLLQYNDDNCDAQPSMRAPVTNITLPVESQYSTQWQINSNMERTIQRPFRTYPNTCDLKKEMEKYC